MRNANEWKPSKYNLCNGEVCPSLDSKQLSPTSYLIAKLVGDLYQKYLPLYAKGDLVDLGCGKVPLYEMYKPYINRNICVDWNSSLHNNPCIDKYCDLTDSLPFDDNAFDTIVVSDVIEHLPKPEIIWQEMHRILRSEGYVILNVPFYYWIHEAPHDYYRYTEYSLKLFAQNSDLTIIELIPIGGPLEIIIDVFSKAYLSNSRLKKKVALNIQRLFSKWHSGGKLSRHAKNFPLGYFVILKKV